MVMLHRRTNLLLILLTGIICFQCQQARYNAKTMYEIRNQSKVKAQSIVGKDEYWLIYNNLKDSIKIWNKYELGQYKSYNGTELSFWVDSILCVNREGRL